MKRLFPHVASKKAASELSRLCDAYVDLVRKIDVVQKVYLIAAEDHAIIRTVIDAPAFEEDLRGPVLDAELQIMRMSGPDDILDFRLTNLRELEPGTPSEAFVPAYAKLLWER